MEVKDDAFLKSLKEFIILFLKYIVILFVITTFITRVVRVEGTSMYPTLKDGEMGLSNIISVKLGNIDRFDLVIVYMEDQNKHIVKRVIGMPGETVSYQDDQLYINGEPVDEPFLDTDYVRNYRQDPTSAEDMEELDMYGKVTFTENLAEIKLGDHEYFLMGDNRPYSSDSRRYGPFQKSDIKSKNVFVIFPFNAIRYEGK
ncbi:hypothetical protein AOC36_05800 [Erysipelothrix larvae]|uniref:Signal peptidase I n=1 Tax=Erysipelothrix larvae TaxID=1514105 RepID=A0A120JTP5_9FIRM|nr:signal peptidase I [Erysipelothrix larvae]AMC93510.1 hypothetical protein AOC36_05800 [Erysipelothrix larvae]